ncbi:MAG: glycerol-3-phosphate dehydrogenase/oxidase [Candidatus Sericytochromatia bacterium]
METIIDEFSASKRTKNIKKLKEEEFDLLIIGGGITGAGVSCCATNSGLKTALVEMNDFASGTSSKSSKLLHGGVRYLQQFKFKLVFEALKDRNYLFKKLPHLAKPLSFLVPVYKGSKEPLFVVNAGLSIYDALSFISRNTATKFHKIIFGSKIKNYEEKIKTKNLKGAIKYFDGICDDARLTLENIKTSDFLGTTIANYIKIIGFDRNEDLEVSHAIAKDLLSGETFKIKAKKFLNASGPWVDAVNKTENASYENKLKPTKGIHLVLPKLTNENALFLKTPNPPQRWFFIIPYGNYTLVGTTDTEAKINDENDFSYLEEDNYAKDDEIKYLLDAVNFYFPEANYTKKDIISSYGGWRPLVAPPKEEVFSESDISREHEIFETESGIVCIAGGKLTTYISMSKEITEYILDSLDFDYEKVEYPKVISWNSNLDKNTFIKLEKTLRNYQNEDVLEYLINKYGTEFYKILEIINYSPDMSKLVEGLSEDAKIYRAEIIYSVLYEMSINLKDFMLRRNRIALKDKDKGLNAVDEILSIMSYTLTEVMNWSEEYRKNWVQVQKEEYILEINRIDNFLVTSKT